MLLQALGASLDEQLLRERLRAEDAEDAYDKLRTLALESDVVGEDELVSALQSLHQTRDPDDRTGKT